MDLRDMYPKKICEFAADSAVIEQRLERAFDASGHCSIFPGLNRDWEPSGSTGDGGRVKIIGGGKLEPKRRPVCE